MKKSACIFGIIMLFVSACEKNDPEVIPAVYDPTPYNLKIGDFPTPDLPQDNKLSVAGVQLGRMLFYEPKLSKDGSQACADCHKQTDAFSDMRQFSIGVEKLPGKRQAMAVMNLAWHQNGLFWDGRAPKIREQALKPIQDPLEMNETLPNAVAKIAAEKRYTDQFIRAFGDATVNSERIGLALEQFMLTMVSNNAKYDHWLRGETPLTDAEERGRLLFFSEFDPISGKKGAECFHCHAGHNFSNDEFMNNGLDAEAAQNDVGRMKVTNNPADKAAFKVPSLRNIEHSAPYMHDGRMATLEQVIDHYDHGVKSSPSVAFILQYNLQPGGLQLTPQNKSDLLAFLKTLTDPDFLSNTAYQKPE